MLNQNRRFFHLFLLAAAVCIAKTQENLSAADQRCLEETTAINSNFNLISTMGRVANNTGLRLINCINDGKGTCNLVNETEDRMLEALCEEAGGDFEVITTSYTCLDKSSMLWTFEAPNRLCFGLSCTENVVNEYYEETLMISEQDAMITFGFVCEYTFLRSDVDLSTTDSQGSPSPQTTEQSSSAANSDRQGIRISWTLAIMPGIAAMLSSSLIVFF
jgi:hypothetical protein